MRWATSYLRETMAPKCIYCRSELTGEVGNDVRIPTLEHIVAYSMGGSDAFATMDASKKYNNDFGSSIDAPFLNQLPVAVMRHKLGLKGYGGTIPPIELKARSLDNGEPATIIIDDQGNVDYRFGTTVVTDEKEKFTRRLVGGDPDRVRQILEGMLRKAKADNRTVYSLTGKVIGSSANMPEIAEIEETSTLKASVTMDGTVWARGLFKIILGLGHFFAGPDWTFSADGGDRVRTVLVCERSQWPDQSLRGFMAGQIPADIASLVGITPEIRGEKYHTLAVLPREGGLLAVVSLFGGDLPESVATLGSERGKLATVNGSLPPSTRVGVRIHPVTRETTWITVEDVLRRT